MTLVSVFKCDNASPLPEFRSEECADGSSFGVGRGRAAHMVAMRFDRGVSESVSGCREPRLERRREREVTMTGVTKADGTLIVARK